MGLQTQGGKGYPCGILSSREKLLPVPNQQTSSEKQISLILEGGDHMCRFSFIFLFPSTLPRVIWLPLGVSSGVLMKRKGA